jgi:hypothetical protein
MLHLNVSRCLPSSLWLQCAGKISAKNWMVVAIDEELRDFLSHRGIPHYYRPVVVRWGEVGGRGALYEAWCGLGRLRWA